MRLRSRIALVGLLCVVGLSAAAQPSSDAVTLKPIKYADLAKVVRSYTGKVVMVDFWAFYCGPCKEHFPILVDLHNKYAKDGFVAISVTLDDPLDAKARAKALQFLQKSNATFTNFLLDETYDFYVGKLHIEGPPAVYFYNRDNRVVKKVVDNDKRDGAAEEKLIQQLLAEGK